MHSNLELVAVLADKLTAPVGGGKWALREVSDVKLRAFTPPGVALEIEARVKHVSTEAATVNVETREGRRVIGHARVRLVSEVGE